MQVFMENARFIEEWNSVPGRHRLELNAFADLRASEYISYVRQHPERLATRRQVTDVTPILTFKKQR